MVLNFRLVVGGWWLAVGGSVNERVRERERERGREKEIERGREGWRSVFLLFFASCKSGHLY